MTTAQKATLVAALVVLPLLCAGGAYVAATSAATSAATTDRELGVAALSERLERLERWADDEEPRSVARRVRHRVVDPVDATAATALEERLRELEGAVARLHERPVPASSSAAAGPRDVEARVGLRDLRDEELLARARRLSGFATASESIPVWAEVLERGPPDAVAGEALFNTGVAHYFLGEHGTAEAFYRRAIERVGQKSSDGQNAAYQLGISLTLQGRHREACDQIVAFADAPDTDSGLAVQSLLMGAPSALRLGDTILARAMYRRVLDLLGDRVSDPDDTYARLWAEKASRAITSIDRR